MKYGIFLEMIYVVSDCFNMYNIIALLTLSEDVPNPKIHGVKTGYAPLHKFKNIDYLSSGFHVYQDCELHFPGEKLMVHISFPSWEFIADRVKVGDRFDILELNRLIGFGVVEEIKK